MKYLILILNIFLVFSCTDSKEVNHNFESKAIQQDTAVKPQFTKGTKLNEIENKESNSNIHFEFYNSTNAKAVHTLYKDSLYMVILNYKSSFDSLTNRLFENNYPSRDVFFYKLRNNLEYSLNDKSPTELRQKYQLDTIVPATVNQIPFDIIFNSKGIFFINGYVEDYLFIQDSKELLDSSLLRVRSKKLMITQKVEVFDK